MHREASALKRRAAAIEREIVAVEGFRLGVLRPVVRRAGKERDRVRHAQFLAVVDERRARHAGGQHECCLGPLLPVEKHRRGGVPHRFVVVGGKPQPACRFGEARERGVDLRCKGVHRGPVLPHPLQRPVKGPGVGLIEAHFMHLRLGGLRQHEHLLVRLHRVDGRLPEVQGNGVRHVAAVAINVELTHPVLHDVNHFLPGSRVVVIEVHHVRPVGRIAVEHRHRKAVNGPVGVHVGMLLEPGMVPGRMVGHQVDNNVHVPSVHRIDQRAEILLGAVVRVHVVVVPDGVGGPEGADVVLAALFANRVDGHEPERVYPHVLKFVEPPNEPAEGALFRGVGHEHLVDGGALHPTRLAHSVNGRRAAGFGGRRRGLASRKAQDKHSPNSKRENTTTHSRHDS